MKPLSLLAIVTATLSASICFADPVIPKPAEVRTFHGYETSVSSSSQESSWNAPIKIESSIKNVTKKALLRLARDGGAGYRIEVRTSAGKAVSLTRFGQNMESRQKTAFGNGPMYMTPGEVFSQNFEITRMFDMTMPDEYEVKLFCSIGNLKQDQIEEVAMSTVHIKIT